MKGDKLFNTPGFDEDNISSFEKKTRCELIECLSELREKNISCLEKARKEGRERLMVEMTAVRSRIEGLISRINPKGELYRYRFDSGNEKIIHCLHEYDMDMEKMISHCRQMMDSAPDIDNRCREILKVLRTIEKTFKKRMSILRTLRLYG